MTLLGRRLLQGERLLHLAARPGTVRSCGAFLGLLLGKAHAFPRAYILRQQDLLESCLDSVRQAGPADAE